MLLHQFLGTLCVFSLSVKNGKYRMRGVDTHTFCLVLSLTILVKLVFSVFSSLRGWWWEWEVGVWNSKESLSGFWKYKMLYNILCFWGKGRNLEGPISWWPSSYLVSLKEGFSLKPLRHLRDSFCVSPFPCSVVITMLSCFFFQVNSSSYIMWSTSWPEVNIKCLSFSPKYNPVKLFFYAHWFFSFSVLSLKIAYFHQLLSRQWE